MPGELEEWQRLVAPWRAEAQRMGFRLLDRGVSVGRRGHECTDFLIDDSGTFLDLHGVLGEVHGFWSATFQTWVERDGARLRVLTVGEAVPPPRPPGGGLFAKAARGLLRSLVPESQRPLPMGAPQQLVAVAERHWSKLRGLEDALVRFDPSDPLKARFEQEGKGSGPST